MYVWEKVRPLRPLPDGYAERYTNVQAAIGLAGLRKLDEWTETTRAHARFMSAALAGAPGVTLPPDPSDRLHVYYQYCVYGPNGRDRDDLVVRCVRRGIDIETLHVDVPPDMELFAGSRAESEGARRASQAIQIPVYSSLTDEQVRRVSAVVKDVLLRRIE